MFYNGLISVNSYWLNSSVVCLFLVLTVYEILDWSSGNQMDFERNSIYHYFLKWFYNNIYY